MLVLNNDGFLLTVREFVEWEYNGGRGDFQPDTTFRTWNSLPVDAKIGYVACSVYGDVVGESSLLIKVGNKTYLLHNAQNDVKKLEAIDEYLNEVSQSRAFVQNQNRNIVQSNIAKCPT